jgi:hypothetical protein
MTAAQLGKVLGAPALTLKQVPKLLYTMVPEERKENLGDCWHGHLDPAWTGWKPVLPCKIKVLGEGA